MARCSGLLFVLVNEEIDVCVGGFGYRVPTRAVDRKIALYVVVYMLQRTSNNKENESVKAGKGKQEGESRK